MHTGNLLCISLVIALAAQSHGSFAEPQAYGPWLEQGKRFQREGEAGGGASRYREAESAFRMALAHVPSNAQAANGLATVLMRLGRTAAAVETLKAVLKTSPDSPSLYARLGYAARYAGHLDLSIRAYRHCAALDRSIKNRIRVREQIAKAYIYRGRYDQSLALFEEIRQLSTQHGLKVRGKTVFYAGLAFLYLDDPERAQAYFKEAVAKERGSLWGRFAGGYERLAARDFEAVKTIAAAIALDTANIADGERRYRMVHLFTGAGDFERALDHFAAAVTAGNFNYPYFVNDALINPLRSSSRFELILAGAKKSHESVTTIDLPN